MDTPTADSIRLLSKAPWGEWGYGSASPDPLAPIIDAANAFVLQTTGHETFAAVPDAQAPLVVLAVRLATEMFAAQTTPEYLETLSDFDLLASFSAGSYSEQRRSPEDMAKARMLAPWPPVHAALLAAMTPEKRDDYLAFLDGKTVPAWEVSEVNWMAGSWSDLWGWTDPTHSWSREW